MPDVSVIMPVYNITKYPDGWVERAISSVLEYQACSVELCIGDDASTDKTPKLLRSLAEKNENIKVAFSQKNTGGAGNSNLAAGMATGNYFILLSCRSWYEPGSLAVMADYLDMNPVYGFVYGNTVFHHKTKTTLKIAEEFAPELFKTKFASSFGYMYRREAWDAGSRYDCTIWIPEEKRFMTIADRSMIMSLIYDRGFDGKHLDITALHYVRGGVTQMNDLLVRYKAQMMNEYKRRWAHVLGG